MDARCHVVLDLLAEIGASAQTPLSYILSHSLTERVLFGWNKNLPPCEAAVFIYIYICRTSSHGVRRLATPMASQKHHVQTLTVTRVALLCQEQDSTVRRLFVPWRCELFMPPRCELFVPRTNYLCRGVANYLCCTPPRRCKLFVRWYLSHGGAKYLCHGGAKYLCRGGANYWCCRGANHLHHGGANYLC
jgi:hypothetical protein